MFLVPILFCVSAFGATSPNPETACPHGFELMPGQVKALKVAGEFAARARESVERKFENANGQTNASFGWTHTAVELKSGQVLPIRPRYMPKDLRLASIARRANEILQSHEEIWLWSNSPHLAQLEFASKSLVIRFQAP